MNPNQRRRGVIPEELKNKTRSDMLDLYAHNAAETMAIQRASVARALDIDPAKDVPPVNSPWKSNTTNHNEGTIGKILAGGLLAGVMGLGGLGLGAAGIAWLNSLRHHDPVTPPPQTTIDPSEYEIELQVKDGKLVPGEARKVRE